MSAVLEYYAAPSVTALLIFLSFSLILRFRLRTFLFGEIGFLYLAFVVVYTIIPAISFAVGDLRESDALNALSPEPHQLSVHLWRHVLFIGSIAAGYLICRGKRRFHNRISIINKESITDKDIVLLLLLISFFISSMLLLSAPVETYYDHYTRYDHLSWLARKFASLCVRLNQGFYPILFVFMFVQYRRYKVFILLAVLAIIGHETTYSHGARILSLVVLLQWLCLYHFLVRNISLAKAAVSLAFMALAFSILEIFREFRFEIDNASSAIAEGGIRSASEFGAVFLTGFHLYAERLHGTLPSVEWPMFFNDLISLVTFNDFVRWNPMDWYARNYFPEAIVAPFTLSPIADSAIWGGEVDLALRGILNGVFFAYVVRWFVRYGRKWWGLVIYIYLYSVCVLTLKYSVFYSLTPLIKTVLPALLLVALLRAIPAIIVSRYKSNRVELGAIGENGLPKGAGMGR